MSTNPAMDRHDKRMAWFTFWERVGKVLLCVIIIAIVAIGLDALGAWPRG